MEENLKEKGCNASRSPDMLAQKEWEVAWNFVNITAGNKKESYCKYYRDHDIKVPEYPTQQANKFFKRKRVQELVEQFREENRANYDKIRDQNIAMLVDIASTESNRKTDRTAAIKELNSMLGLNIQNINMSAENTITIEFEDNSNG